MTAAAHRPLVLVVDDQSQIRALFSRALEKAGFEVHTSVDGHGALDQIADRIPALVLLDANLPDISGETVLQRLREDPRTTEVPVIIVTGDAQIERRIAGLGGGANDYLVKPVAIGELVARVHAQLRVRDHWLARLDNAAASRRELAQLLTDIDNTQPFSTVESTIRAVLMSKLDIAEVRVDTSGSPPLTSESPDPGRAFAPAPRAHASPLVERDLGGATVRIPLEAAGAVYAVLVVQTREEPGHTLSTLIDLAPQVSALLHAPVSLDLKASRDRDEIRALLEPGAISPHFQPIVDIASGRALGFEGLSRFADGMRPDLRFRQAGRVGMGPDLEVAAIRSLVDGSQHLPDDAWLSLNVSVPTLLTVELGELLRDADRSVVLEITEHELVSDYAAVIAAVKRLEGVRLAVDDAGSGYASLRHVYELQPEIVKLDRAWIAGIHDDPVRRALVTGLATFADELDAVLVGEGVELEAERDCLADLGIPFGQGYLFGRPAPAETWVR